MFSFITIVHMTSKSVPALVQRATLISLLFFLLHAGLSKKNLFLCRSQGQATLDTAFACALSRISPWLELSFFSHSLKFYDESNLGVFIIPLLKANMKHCWEVSMLLAGKTSSFCTIENTQKIKFQPFTRLINSRKNKLNIQTKERNG
jgi:hypothetical protein